jgi:uncharacterized membrane protein YesL
VASKAEDSPAAGAAAGPTLPGALKAAGIDFYYNSVRLVALNLVWGIALIVVLLLAPVWPLGAFVLATLLALPVAGMFRVAALIARREGASFRDGIDAWRRYFAPSLVAGGTILLVVGVLTVDLVVGLQSGELVWLALGTMAFWGLVVAMLLVVCWWPLLVDPSREIGGRKAFRLASYLVLAHPVRIAVLALLLGVVLVVSTVAFAALVTISLSFVALAACHYVLPAADRLEAQLAARRRPLH